MWCCSERDDARGTWGGRRTTHLLPWRQHQSLTRVPRRVSAATFINTSKHGSIILHSLHGLAKFISLLLFFFVAFLIFKKKTKNDDDNDDEDNNTFEWMNEWISEWIKWTGRSATLKRRKARRIYNLGQTNWRVRLYPTLLYTETRPVLLLRSQWTWSSRTWTLFYRTLLRLFLHCYIYFITPMEAPCGSTFSD